MSDSPFGRIKKALFRSGHEVQLTPEELLRVKLWRARASHSRIAGIVMLGVSGVLLSIAFVTQFGGFEMVAIASFVIGVFLIAVELEPRVKLYPSSSSLYGPLVSLADYSSKEGFDGPAAYVPREGGVEMLLRGSSKTEPLLITPIGRGISDSLRRELGSLKDVGRTYAQTWVPRALEEGLELAGEAKLELGDTKAEATFRRPFVRPLCANEDFNRRVCSRIGCPLVSSVGEVVADSVGNKVTFLGCVYDRVNETARASYTIERAS